MQRPPTVAYAIPNTRSRIHVPPQWLPIVVVPAVPDAASQALLKVLASMGADAEGQQRLRLLGLDGLVPIADAQRTELRK